MTAFAKTPEWFEELRAEQEKRQAMLAEAAGKVGMSAEELQRKLIDAGWHANDGLDRFLARDDWPARLNARLARIEAAFVSEEGERLERAIAGAFGAEGPVRMAQLPMDRLLDLVPKRLRGLAEAYDSEEHGSRILAGPTGVGKTAFVAHVFMKAVRAAIRDEAVRVRQYARENNMTPSVAWGCRTPWTKGGVPQRVFVTAATLAAARARHSLGDDEAPLVTEAMRTRLLAIDDLGWETARDNSIGEVLNARYNAGRPTLITTGLTPAELRAKYSDAVIRRALLDGVGKGQIVDLHAKPREAGAGVR